MGPALTELRGQVAVDLFGLWPSQERGPFELMSGPFVDCTGQFIMNKLLVRRNSLS